MLYFLNYDFKVMVVLFLSRNIYSEKTPWFEKRKGIEKIAALRFLKAVFFYFREWENKLKMSEIRWREENERIKVDTSFDIKFIKPFLV